MGIKRSKEIRKSIIRGGSSEMKVHRKQQKFDNNIKILAKEKQEFLSLFTMKDSTQKLSLKSLSRTVMTMNKFKEEDSIKQNNSAFPKFLIQSGNNVLMKPPQSDVAIQLTWENLKKYNKAILDTYQYNFLKAFGWFRSYYVNKLLDHIRDYLGCTECRDENYQNCLPIRDICKPIAVGSQDLTSDYDVTINSTGYFAVGIVYLFNKIFDAQWNEQSGIIFDTNVYGQSYFSTADSNYEICGLPKPVVTSYVSIRDKSSIEYSKMIYNQRKMALMKILFHCYKPDSESNLVSVNKTCTSVIDLLAGGNQSIMYLDALDDFKKMLSMKNILQDKQSEKRYIDAQRAHSEQVISHSMLEKMKWIDVYDLQMMNELYYNKLLELDKKKLAFEMSKYSNEKALQFIDAVSASNFYANEPYFTKGAIFHVVGKIQGLADFPLELSDFYDSCLENFGDFLKEVNHAYTSETNNYPRTNTISESAQISLFIHSTKYLVRMFLALFSIVKNTEKNNTNMINKLSEVCDFLEVLRKQFRTGKYKNAVDNDIKKVINIINSSVKQNVNIEKKAMIYFSNLIGFNKSLLDLPEFLLVNYVLKYVKFPISDSKDVSKSLKQPTRSRSNSRRASTVY